MADTLDDAGDLTPNLRRQWVVSQVREYLESTKRPTRDDFFRRHRGAIKKDEICPWGAIVSEAGDAVPSVPIPEGHFVKGVSTLVGPKGQIRGQWVKTDTIKKRREELLEGLLASLPKRIPVRSKSIASPLIADAEDVMAVYPMGDPHLGMLAWGRETGGDDFDIEIAQRLLMDAIDTLTRQEPFAETALIANLGDFFHADNNAGVTTRSGNVLDVDTRWSRVMQTGVDVMVYLIDAALRAHNQVHVINEIGNHDDHSSVMLSVALDCYYRNEPRVTIDLSPSKFHYHHFGKNLLGVTHGDSVKHADLESIMAHDCAEQWSDTQNRFWYVGHIHTTRRYEYRNCLVESFRTLAPGDAWTAGSGYRSGRDMNRICLHCSDGEVARTTVSARYLARQYASDGKTAST